MNSTLKTLSQSEINEVHGGFQIISMPDNRYAYPQPAAIDKANYYFQHKILLDYMQEAQ